MKFGDLPTPSYIVDEALILKNLEVLSGIKKETGCRILLAQKAFSMFSLYPLIGQYLDGTTSSGLYEARLGKEHMGGENHVYSPAYRDDEFDEIISICDYIVFNSFSQLNRFKEPALRAGRSIGLRINPEHSTQEGHEIYDPCAPGSRLGITLDTFQGEMLEDVEGLHFHTLCQQNSHDLWETLDALEEKFGPYIHGMKWINFGGGHHITREDYDIPLLLSCIHRIQDKYGVRVYLEPGEAVALNAGFLVTKVLDTMYNNKNIAILDSSAACHMPDVIEMPYRPPLMNSGFPNERAHTYTLGGPTCLAGDIIGEYSFDEPLTPGDTLVFEDMAIYTMVKNNTFNGMPLPAIVLKNLDGEYQIVKEFGYEDFKMRLS